MKMTSEMSLRILADGELVAVAGGRRLHCGPVFPSGPSKSVTQTNSVGDVTLSVSGNSGEITVSLSQSNSAS